MIKITPYDETYIRLTFDSMGTEKELSDAFTFFAPNYRFHPKFKAKIWDGKIRLYNERTRLIYRGLLPAIFSFARQRKESLEVDPQLNPYSKYDRAQIEKFIQELNVSNGAGDPIELRDYQVLGIVKSLEQKRNIIVAATSAGKSLMIYVKARLHIEEGRRVLLVVPTTLLVEQMYGDFREYSKLNGWDVDSNVQMLYSGKEKLFTTHMMISTWQSLHAMMKNDPKAFRSLADRVDVLIADEAHTFKAVEVAKLIEAFHTTQWRTGTTGTLDGAKINELTLRGLFGDIHKVVSARELIDAGHATEVHIKIHLLKYSKETRAFVKGMKYQEEIAWLIGNNARNEYIRDLAVSCQGTTLVLFNFVERHGVILHDAIKASTERPVYLIHGDVLSEERERIRQAVKAQPDAILVASSKILSTGVNIPSIEHVIFTTPSKASNSIRQSIGRGMRLKEGKERLLVHDIADDLSIGDYTNTTLRHLQARVDIYDKEGFEHSMKQIQQP